MMKDTDTFKKPTGETKDTDYILRIMQNIGGSWVHLIDVDVVNSGDLSVDLTQEDLDTLLKQMMNSVYRCDKMQLGTDNKGVIFSPPQGPVSIEVMARPKINA
jgi:hypothetical protein